MRGRWGGGVGGVDGIFWGGGSMKQMIHILGGCKTNNNIWVGGGGGFQTKTEHFQIFKIYARLALPATSSD